ncbi:copper chaperone PCu(A)C [Streptomyces pinistramenti]|uniref:copper chaperone PCu(A)C n=1 Tax=Streptomyces pinistramenti TaxID=2884812 RepID=UPI001D062171|nr:copper chaperone PCu(A)C [Streptomyces pinistramenti]MCB5911556.1 copper chaperone PCu(A)C [Streptomyces pinistramenti]
MNRRTATALALTAASALALAGCDSADSGPELKVTGAYMPQPVTQKMAGAFLVVENTGGTDDKLTSVTSDLADDVSIHKTTGNKMEQVNSLPIPAHEELTLSRGGNHLMFMGLKKKPSAGDKITVELHFGTSDPVKVEVPVKDAAYTPKK